MMKGCQSISQDVHYTHVLMHILAHFIQWHDKPREILILSTRNEIEKDNFCIDFSYPAPTDHTFRKLDARVCYSICIKVYRTITYNQITYNILQQRMQIWRNVRTKKLRVTHWNKNKILKSVQKIESLIFKKHQPARSSSLSLRLSLSICADVFLSRRDFTIKAEK